MTKEQKDKIIADATKKYEAAISEGEMSVKEIDEQIELLKLMKSQQKLHMRSAKVAYNGFIHMVKKA